MSKIAIYNDSCTGGLGASEYTAVVLARGLSVAHDVDILHHRVALTREQLERFSGDDLSGVSLRYVEALAYEPAPSHNPITRYRHARRWLSSLSRRYEIFIALVHGLPPFCRARTGMLVALFPFYIPPYALVDNPTDVRNRTIWTRWSPAYNKWEWERRLGNYGIRTALSKFSRCWTKRWWGIDSELLKPPVETDFFPEVSKQNRLLSVTRFATDSQGRKKRHNEMFEAFRSVCDTDLAGWQYSMVGTLSESPEERASFSRLATSVGNAQVELITNADRCVLKNELAAAKIFWNATGYEEDENIHPQMTEHTGIATVEAMAAGCVPVVMNCGAQKEIVRHGYNGYLCETLEHMQEYTALLAHDETWRQKLSEAARESARSFDRDRFLRQAKDLLKLSP